MLHEVAVLTSVNPALDDEWAVFSGEMSFRVGPAREQLVTWWQALGRQLAQDRAQD
jgi:hypothetical protein